MATSSFIDDFEDFLIGAVTVEPFVSRASNGTPTFGTATDYPARVNYELNNVRNAAGQEVVSRGYAILNCVDTIKVNSRITLEDGSQPLILQVNKISDEEGDVGTKLFFA